MKFKEKPKNNVLPNVPNTPVNKVHLLPNISERKLQIKLPKNWPKLNVAPRKPDL